MLRTIADNAGTIVVSLVLIGVITGIVVHLRRDRKQGKSSCGGNCGCCPMAGSCHKPQSFSGGAEAIIRASRFRERGISMIQTTVEISGMVCGMCEAHINDAIRAAFPVKKATSSRAKGETVMAYLVFCNDLV